MLVGVVEQLLAGGEVPFAPRRDDLHVRHQRVGAELESYLIVALAGRAVRDRICARFPRDLDQALRDQRSSDRRSEQVLAFVYGVRAEHRKHEIADELFAQIFDENLLHAQHARLLAGRLDFFALTDVRRERDDFAAVHVLQPFEDDRSVETARIGEHHFVHVVHDRSRSSCLPARATALCRTPRFGSLTARQRSGRMRA